MGGECVREEKEPGVELQTAQNQRDIIFFVREEKEPGVYLYFFLNFHIGVSSLDVQANNREAPVGIRWIQGTLACQPLVQAMSESCFADTFKRRFGRAC